MTDAPQVHAAVAAVISEMPGIGKNSRITEGPQKYAYRGIEDIKAELKPVLAKHGVHYSPHTIRDAVDGTYETKNGSTWQRVRLTVTYRIYGPDGSFFEAEGRGEGADNSDKANGKAMTGAEKQMLLQVFCIADSEDPDHDRAPEQNAAQHGTPASYSAAQAKGHVLEVLRGRGMDRADAIAKAAVLWENHGPKGDGPFTESDLAKVDAAAAAEVTT